jgi:hypothetical protein
VNLIGIVGQKRSGKSTASQYFIHNHNAKSFGFAEPIRNMLRGLGLTDRELYGDLKEVPCDKLSGQTPRYAMQRLGDEWGRFLMHEKFWIDRIDECTDFSQLLVCDDVRRQNEADYIKSKGGMTIKIVRPGLVSNDSHGSEIEVDSIVCDYTIVNDATVTNMYYKLSQIASYH